MRSDSVVYVNRKQIKSRSAATTKSDWPDRESRSATDFIYGTWRDSKIDGVGIERDPSSTGFIEYDSEMIPRRVVSTREAIRD